jgi:arsenate reductase
MKKILILCTGNSCRSKMAQACLQHIDAGLDVRSAGTHPARCTHPLAIEVMDEIGMPITDLLPHNVEEYIHEEWDFVITVCDHASKTCPVFVGVVKQRLHLAFPDPAQAKGTKEEQLAVFHETRDRIVKSFNEFYHQYIQVNGHEERL